MRKLDRARRAAIGCLLTIFASVLSLVPVQAADTKLYDMCQMITTTTGTGTITLTSTPPSWLSFATCGVQNGDRVTYVLQEGNNREMGEGVYNSAGPTLTRATILNSTAGAGTPITLAGAARVAVTISAEDVQQRALGKNPSDDAAIIGDSATTGTWRVIPDSDGATQKLQYDNATNTFSAGTDDDVPEVGDFTALVGGTGIDNNAGTLDLDLTEVTPTATFGAGAFTTLIFDAGATDPQFLLGSGTLTIEAVTSLRQADAANAGGQLRLLEDPGVGANFLAFLAPASITTDATCTLENDANFIPDSCVGDGSDDDVPEVGDFGALVGGTGITNSTGTLSFDATEVTTATWGANNFTTMVFSTDGVDLTWDYTTTDAVATLSGGGSTPGVALDDQGFIRFLEEDAGGSNYKAFAPPAAITADTTCTFEDDANFIPDSCVGDGSDDDIPEVGDFTALVGGTGITNSGGTLSFDATEVTSATWGSNNFTSMTFSTDGIDLTWDYTTTDGFAILSGGGSTPGVALDDQGIIRFLEEDAGGSNYKAFQAPAAITADTTCTFEDDANFIPDSCVGDGSDDDVPEVGDFTALVGGTGIDNNSGTLDLDLTEVTPTATFGAGAFTTLTFDAGAVDPVFSFGSGTILLEGVTSFRRADAANAGGEIRLLEDPGTGANFIAFVAPASITSDVTCTLENDGNPIPDSCVGDGTDGGGSATPGGSDTQVQYNDAGAFGGDAGMTFNETTDDLTLAGDVSVGDDLLFPNSASVINWNAGDVTLTHSSNLVTLAGGDLKVDQSSNLAGSWIVGQSGNTHIWNNGLLGWSTAGGVAISDNFFTVTDVRIGRSGTQTFGITADVMQLTGFPATDPTALHIYNTFTDASNYERGFARWSSNVFEIGSEAAGTGTARDIRLDSATGIVEVDYGSAAGGQIRIRNSGSANNVLAVGGGANANISYESNTLGLHYALIGDTTGSGGAPEFRLGAGGTIKWGNNANLNAGSFDIQIARAAAGIVSIGGVAQAPGGLRLTEDTDNGSNYIEFVTPSAITSNVTCTLEDDANPIPDSCVGDGTDGGGGGGAQISGTPVDNQVAVWTNSTTIEGDSAFTFDTATDALSVSTTGVITTGTIELGAASDTTLARSGVGDVSIEGNVIVRAGSTAGGDLAGTYPNPTVAPDTVALTTDTTGVYVAQVADGTGVDGTASTEGATYTPTLDLTELNTFTLGAGSATGIIFDAGATDPAIEVASGSMTIDIGGTNETTLTASAFSPGVDAGSDLGTTTLAWNALHGDTGFVLNIENGDWVATHTTGILTVGTGDLRVTTAGTNTASVVTVGGTQTLTGKSIAAGQITAGTLNIGNNAATVGTLELANGTANTLSATGGVLSIEGVALVATTRTLTGGTGIAAIGDLSADRTITLDTTEVSSATWGAGAFTTFTYDAGATDPTETFGSGTYLLQAVASFRQADAANAGGQIRLLEDPGTGANFIAFAAPAAITSDVTCTLENDANPIPDSCVGDGTDGGGTVAGSDTQVIFNDGGSAYGGDAGLTFNKTTDVLSMGGFTVAPGTLTDPKNNTITQTWNDAADTFKGLSIDITSTNAAAASKAFEVSYAGTPYFRVANGPQGDVQFFNSNSGVQFAESAFAWFARVGGADVFRIQSAGAWRQLVAGAGIQVGDRAILIDDAADVLAQRNSTNAQAFRIYNTFTDASNYERANLAWSGNQFSITTSNAGTGSARHMDITSAGTLSLAAASGNEISFYIAGSKRWAIDSGGMFVPSSNATYNIGADDSAQIRDLFMDGTQLSLDDNTALRFREAEANGDNYVEFLAPAILGANVTCTFENDGSPIPDSCVGDGVDAGAGGGISNVVEDTSPSLGGDLNTNTFDIIVESGDRVLYSSDSVLSWNSDNTPLTSPSADLGIARNAAGVAEINNGTAGTFRDLKLQKLETTSTIELGAASDTTIARSAAGEATLEGDAIKHAGKQVMWVPASAMKADATSPASCGDAYDSGSNDVSLFVCAFDTGATEERADFGIAMPRAWNEGTISYQVLWTNAAGLTTETVQWELACVAISDDDTMNATMGSSVTVSDTWLAQNDMHMTAESSALTIGGTPAELDYVTCRISRDTSVDNMTGDALLVGVKVFWTDNASTLAE